MFNVFAENVRGFGGKGWGFFRWKIVGWRQQNKIV